MKPLWAHQFEALEHIDSRKSVLLDMAMGTGKSRVVVEWINRQPEQGCMSHGYPLVLILAPKSVVPVWPRQIDEFGNDDIETVVLSGPIKKRTEDLIRHVNRHDPYGGFATVVVTNFEILQSTIGYQTIANVRWSAVVLDESHRIKSPTGKTSKNAAKIHAAKRICLTGTPQPHSPLDLFGQFRFLDPTLFGKSWVRFRSEYAQLGGPNKNWVQGFKNLDRLADKIEPYTYRATEDAVDLPDRLHVERVGELSPSERRVYDQLEKDFVAEFGGDLVAAPNVLARLTKLRQVTSGYLVDTESAGTTKRLGESKRRLFSDTLSDLPGEPVVVSACFHDELDQIRQTVEEFGRKYSELSGRRRDVSAKWEPTTGDEVLGVQVASGSLGIDLTAASKCVFFSPTYSGGDYEQMLKRCHRPGQRRDVTIVHLMIENSMDSLIARAIAAGKDITDTVMWFVDEKKGIIR